MLPGSKFKKDSQMKKILITQFVILSSFQSLLAGTALEIDPAGRPNESGTSIAEKLSKPETSLEERFKYFAHYSPVIRMKAAHSMTKEGEKAMPFIIKGLQSKNRHVVRASCDAITAFRGFFGVNVKGKTGIPPEIAAKAVPYLAPIVNRDDIYLQTGALQALSKCGKAAAPHLPKVMKFLKHDEWWLRISAAYVIQGVGSPEADKYGVDLAKAVLSERYIMCLNGMTNSLKELLKTSSATDEVAKVVGKNLGDMERAYIRQRGRDILEVMGGKAKAALPYLDKLIAREDRALEQAGKNGTLDKWDKWDLENLKKTREKIATASTGSK